MSDLSTPDLRHHIGNGSRWLPLALPALVHAGRLNPATTVRPQVAADVLAGVPLLRSLEPGLARQLAARAVLQQLPRRAVVLEQGGRETDLFVLLQGQAQVVRHNQRGRSLVIDQLRPGDHFGELSAIDGQPQGASVRCTVPSAVLVIGRHDFLDCLEASQTLLPALLQVMVQRLRRKNRRITLLALHDVRGCVLQQLMDLAEPEDGLQVVQGRISRQAVADMIGASRAMVSRVMMGLTRSGALEARADGSTVLHCEAALQQAAD